MRLNILYVTGILTAIICHTNASPREFLGNDEKGNYCPQSTPWPCKTKPVCLSFDFICDGTNDCPDGYDEDPSLCTAKDRPAKTYMQLFIKKNEHWLVPEYLGEGSSDVLAENLIESKTIDDYKKNVGLSDEQEENLRELMEAVAEGRKIEAILMGMPASAWTEIYVLFGRIVASGFLEDDAMSNRDY